MSDYKYCPQCDSELIHGADKRIAELNAEVERLELVIHTHNRHLDDLCDFSRNDGRCAAFVCRGIKCPDCPTTHKVDMEEDSGDAAGGE